jgi:zinc/manganese transport system permease protein
MAAAIWLLVAPAADQPVLTLVERALGLGPERFLSAAERDAYTDAAAEAQRWQGEVERLNASERRSRWQGVPLADDEVRRIGSYQQSFNEMARGERFVLDTLRAKARERERWWVGVPMLLLAALGGIALALPRRLRFAPAPSP